MSSIKCNFREKIRRLAKQRRTGTSFEWDCRRIWRKRDIPNWMGTCDRGSRWSPTSCWRRETCRIWWSCWIWCLAAWLYISPHRPLSLDDVARCRRMFDWLDLGSTPRQDFHLLGRFCTWYFRREDECLPRSMTRRRTLKRWEFWLTNQWRDEILQSWLMSFPRSSLLQ